MTSTRASRDRPSSTPIRRSRSSRSPRPSRGTSSSSSGSIACSRSERTSGPPRRRCPWATSCGDRRGSRSSSTSGVLTASPATVSRRVMTWQIESFTDVGGNKDRGVREVHRLAVADRPAVRARRQRPAGAAGARMGGQRSTRWACRERRGTTATSSIARRPSSAWRSTPTSSTNSGWFSDRTECYLASGRPALAQDTGWTAHLPAGEGLIAFSTPEEALAGIDRVNGDYPRHARRAVEIAREYFDASRVLGRLLEEAGS